MYIKVFEKTCKYFQRGEKSKERRGEKKHR
jgi:hypothetical protein